MSATCDHDLFALHPFSLWATLESPRRRGRVRGLAMILIGLALVTGCSNLDMIDPDPVPVASSFDRTISAIDDALRREGWSKLREGSGHWVVGRELEGVPVRANVLIVGSMVEVTFVPQSVGLSGGERDAHLRRARRSLHDLQERIEYLVESADLTAE